ncbi:hypothetical protein AVL48_08245 [Amycolatopsis regifaucium]|uniref:PE domain-containing protein n=1 Tax=Amycolatopsis regifaucium TaxID=546365 RepID=A0A154MG97_9PSEU|nr:hypothetical protein AVL48_08245 [Amycolatopsis regifaucium]OKA06499.1 hypothetical protein ATP06_0222750 [Amycolatopsis regifaucium]
MPEGQPTYDPGMRWNDSMGLRPSGGSYGASVAEGAGFKYDEATLHELVKEWTDLAKEYLTDRIEAELIAIAQPPGMEYASGGNAEITRESGNALMTTLDQRASYCESMAKKYAAALGKYATVEEQSVVDINQQPKGIV